RSAPFSCCARRRRGATYVREASTSVKDKGDMAQAPKPIRRVVTGNDAQGRSRVLFDSAPPNVNPRPIVPATSLPHLCLYPPLPARRRRATLRFPCEPPAAGGPPPIVQPPGTPRG